MKPEAADSPEVGGTALLPGSRDQFLLAASVLGAFVCGLALHDKGIVLFEEGQILTEAEATRLQAALAMVASALIAGQLSRPSVRSPPPGQRIRRARGKEK